MSRTRHQNRGTAAVTVSALPTLVPNPPPAHTWVANALFVIPDPGNAVTLAPHLLVGTVVACYTCQRGYTAAVAEADCPGQPGDVYEQFDIARPEVDYYERKPPDDA